MSMNPFDWVTNPSVETTKLVAPEGTEVKSAWGQLSDKVLGLYDDVTGVTTAEEANAAQTQAINEAKAAQEQGFQRSVEQMSPYAQAGGQFLGGLAQGVASGAYTPGVFQYGGQQPGSFDYLGGQSKSFDYRNNPNITSDYQGQQQGVYDYTNGQQGVSAYQGGPEMGSIQSFMGDPTQTPGYQFQLEQGQKAIDRAAAAGGRFGGGQTAKELMKYSQGLASQAYGDEFNRAAQEREAQRFGESDIYGRGMSAMQAANLAEQAGYGRQQTAFDAANQAEQSAYNRAENQAQIARQIEADQYGRAESAFDRRNLAEQSNYDRARLGYGIDTGLEQQQYDRQRQGYDYEAARLGDLYNKQLGMVDMGRNAAQSMSNAAIGQGTALSNLAIQQGNANAANIAAQGTTAGNLLGLINQSTEMGKDAASLMGGM